MNGLTVPIMIRFLSRFKTDWLPMLLLVLSAGSIFFVFFRKELLYLTLIVFGYLFLAKFLYKKTLTTLAMLCVIFFSFLAINYFFANREQSVQKLLANGVIFLSSMFAALYYHSQKTSYLKHLYFVLKIILFHSILNFLAYPIVKPLLIEISNDRYDCLTFFNVFFYLGDTHLFSVFGFDMSRNQGIFWEPGVLQIVLNLLLFIESFIFKRRGFIFSATILGIISTFSTTGLFVMLIQLFISFFKIVKTKTYLAPLFLIVLGGVFLVAEVNVRDKLSGSGQLSFQARFFDLVQPFQILIDNPLTGVGLDDEQYVEVRQQPKYSLNLGVLDFSNRSKGSTNSVMFFLAAAGIPFSLLVFYLLYYQQFFFEMRLWFFIFIVISLMTEPLLLRPFFLTFVMSGGIYLISKFTWKGF